MHKFIKKVGYYNYRYRLTHSVLLHLLVLFLQVAYEVYWIHFTTIESCICSCVLIPSVIVVIVKLLDTL